MRKNATEAEARLWSILRNNGVNGMKFRRQHPLSYRADIERSYVYITDFICIESGIVIEVDGGYHIDMADYDAERDRHLTEMGFKVVRLSNEQVMQSDNLRDLVLNAINKV